MTKRCDSNKDPQFSRLTIDLRTSPKINRNERLTRLSFVLPCYNVGKYIGVCLDSLFRQDIPLSEYEVVCVNDCSTDKTRDIILDYQKLYPNIRLIDHINNQTAGGARNTGIDAASGDYIWFVDPDDYIKENCLSSLLKRAEDNNLDIALFNFDITTEFNGDTKPGDTPFVDSVVCDGYAFLDKYFNKNIGKNSIVWRQLYRKALLIDSVLRYPILRVSEDAIFSWKALFLAKRVQSESQSRYVYRKNQASTTSNLLTPQKVFASTISSPYEIYQMMQSFHIREDYIKMIENAIRSDFADFWLLYPQLKNEDKTVVYRMLMNAQQQLCTLSKYVGLRRQLALFSRYAGKKMFNYCIIKTK